MSLNPSIKKVVPESAPSASANYDYYDIAEGTGIKNFFGCMSLASGGIVDHYLTTDSSDYSAVTSDKSLAGPGYIIDTNYEVTFNLSKIIRGKVRVSVVQGLAAGGAGQFVFCIFKLYKVSGGVTTQIGSEVCTNKTTSTAAVKIDSRENVFFNTGGRIHFKKGDSLRLNIKVYASTNVATGYGVDPAGRDDVATTSGGIIITAGRTTQLKVGVPFVIDV